MSHTPGPWVFELGSDNRPEDLEGQPILGSIVGDDYHIARIWSDVPEAEANAHFIVTACNNFDSLVDALGKVELIYSEYMAVNQGGKPLEMIMDIMTEIRTLLAKIKSEMEGKKDG